jgi:hypothetical protein
VTQVLDDLPIASLVNSTAILKNREGHATAFSTIDPDFARRKKIKKLSGAQGFKVAVVRS